MKQLFNFRSESHLSKMDHALLFLFSGLILFYVVVNIYIIDKGFSLSDEGLQYAQALPETLNNKSPFNFDLLYKLVYRYFNFEFDIIGVRVLKNLLILAAIPFLYSIIRKYKINTALFVVLIAMLIGTAGLMEKSLSYNIISFISVLFTAFSLMNSVKTNYILYLNYFACGLIVFVSFLAKPHLFLGLTVLVSGFIFINDSLSNMRKKIIIFFIFLSAILFSFWFLRYHFTDFNPINILQNASDLSKADPLYSLGNLLKRFLAPIKWLLLLHVAGYCLAFSFDQYRNWKNKLISFGIFILLTITFIYSHIPATDFSLLTYGCVTITAFFIGIGMYHIPFKSIRRNDLLIFFVLYSAPLLCLSGSSSYFFRAGQLYVFFWILLIVIFLSSYHEFKPFFYIYIFLISLLLTLNFLNWNIFKPYDQPSLTRKFIQYNYRKNSSIYLEESVVSYLGRLKAMLNKNLSNDKNIVALYGMQGDLILTGYQNYYTSLMWNSYQWNYHKRNILEPIINHSDSLFILTNQLKEKNACIKEGAVIIDSLSDSNKKYYLLKFR